MEVVLPNGEPRSFLGVNHNSNLSIIAIYMFKHANKKKCPDQLILNDDRNHKTFSGDSHVFIPRDKPMKTALQSFSEKM